YDQHGKGAPQLLLLHSLLTELSVFDGVLSKLAKSRRVTRINLPGFGRSTPVQLDSVGAHADHVARVMGALELPRDTDVFGNGFGAFVALELAIRHGARFRRLVVADTLAVFPEAARWIRPRRRRWRAPWRGAFLVRTTKKFRARATARCSSNPMRCWRKWASFWPPGRIEPAGGSGAAEPVVALVLPIAARVLVGDEDRGDVLGVFEAQLGGHAQLHGEAVLRRQDLVGEAQGEQRLRVQGGRHVDAGRVIVG